jgi:ABC-type polysaccharide/polyol phosphate export permease
MILIIFSVLILKGLPILFLFMPFILCIHLALTIGLAVISSILYVRWRDTKYILEAMLLLLFYLTPVFYSINLVKTSFSALLFKVYTLNPFVGILNLYRLALLKGFYRAMPQEQGFLYLVAIPVCFSIAVLILGLHVYNKNKYRINDYLSY